MNSFTTQEKKQLTIYALVAFALPYLLGILMWQGRQNGANLSAFSQAQMFYPAAGVMLAVLLTRRGDALRPKKFFFAYFALTAFMLVCAVLSVFLPAAPVFALINIGILAGSVLLWLALLREAKEKQRAYGLAAQNAKQSALCVLLFVALYFFRNFLAFAAGGSAGDFFAIFSRSDTWRYLMLMPLTFLLAFAAFFGEEYGWRYFFQSLLQKRFGAVRGVLLVGVLWGLWHLPLNLFYYSAPGYALQSILAQQITCIALGIFMAYTYMKTDNIWVPTILHFANNNLVPIFVDPTATDLLANRTLSWGDLPLALVVNGILFGTFLLAAPFRRGAARLPTMDERAEAAAVPDADASPEQA